MRFTTCQTVCTDLKLDDEYTSLKHEHVLFRLHLVRHGGCQDILRVKISGFTSPGCQQDQRQNCQGTVLWCEVGDRWYDIYIMYIYLIIYTSGHLYSWYSIRGIYNVFMVYMDIYLGCVFLLDIFKGLHLKINGGWTWKKSIQSKRKSNSFQSSNFDWYDGETFTPWKTNQQLEKLQFLRGWKPAVGFPGV